MPSFNKVILCGNLTRDPELRYTPKGTPLAKFGLAMNHQWTSETGEKKENVVFIDCVVWSKAAETLAQYTKKGHPLLVEGRLNVESWEDKESKETRHKTNVVVETFQFLKGKPAEGEQPKSAGKAKPKASDSKPDGETDDVPF